MRVHQQTAYVLLTRPYSETSWIVEIFSRDYGRLALMAKGARRLKSPFKGVLLPFQPTLLSWTGKGEVPTLTAAEIKTDQFNLFLNELGGDALVCGFYCNELVANLLHRHDPHARLFDQYHDTILGLHAQHNSDELSLSEQLRDFERIIIKETGYGVNFHQEAEGGGELIDEKSYLFHRGKGFVSCDPQHPKAVLGKVITALDQTPDGLLSDHERSQGKLLMRDILSQTLGYKEIKSRELFFPKSRQAS